MGLTFDAEYLAKSAQSFVEKAKSLEAKLEAANQKLGVMKPYEPITGGALNSVDVSSDVDWGRYEAAYAEALPIAKRNSEVAAHNEGVLRQIVTAITAAGIGTETKRWVRNKTKSETADWLVLLRNAAPKCGTTEYSLNDRHTRLVASREEALKKREANARAKQQAQEASDREKLKVARVVEVALAIGMDATSDIDEIKSELRKRDKYLDLAVAGVETRNDWSEGCYRVENALSRFTIETPADQEIFDEWQSRCEDFDDGRVFRDCEHNYGVVMGMASPELVALWTKLEAVST